MSPTKRHRLLWPDRFQIPGQLPLWLTHTERAALASAMLFSGGFSIGQWEQSTLPMLEQPPENPFWMLHVYDRTLHPIGFVYTDVASGMYYLSDHGAAYASEYGIAEEFHYILA
ncbi:MAG: hypothetical protein E6Q97_12310 [Desulfurellales bacterium]|nr:MAG: hypothetical protein E6Q97_12310 [Desulfurellales bacterium]